MDVPSTARRTALTRLTLALGVLGLCGAAYWQFALRYHQSTDDAYAVATSSRFRRKSQAA